MKKLLAMAMTATLLTAGSAFAVERHLTPLLTTPNASAPGAPAGTSDNAASCDIGVTPAATLLLPYFEVETNPALRATGANTLFTITNTSPYPQIAHVTVWTDWSFPVLDFNIFLTGYDVQGISLNDVINGGVVAPANGTSNTTPKGSAAAGSTLTGTVPFSNTSNPNFLGLAFGANSANATCTGLPGGLPQDLVTAVRNALTTGTGYTIPGNATASCSSAVGGNHGTKAVGYVTVDVAATCSTKLPTDPTYYTGPTAEILFDNVLIGDYQQLGPSPSGAGTTTGYDAGGNPMVHIRAVPEGGLSGRAGGLPVPTVLPFTFYDRYTQPGTARTGDRRQPLPSTFAARYIQSAAAGFQTDYKIWREGVTGANAACTAYASNSVLNIVSIVRFDEAENSFGFGSSRICSPCTTAGNPTLPETSRTSTTDPVFPVLGNSAVGGWMYLNLSNAGTSADGTVAGYSAQRPGFNGGATFAGPGLAGTRTTSQNWVIISMFGAFDTKRLAVDFDAAWLGNGCTPAPAAGAVIAPAQSNGGALVCPTPTAVCAPGTLPPVLNP